MKTSTKVSIVTIILIVITLIASMAADKMNRDKYQNKQQNRVVSVTIFANPKSTPREPKPYHYNRPEIVIKKAPLPIATPKPTVTPLPPDAYIVRTAAAQEEMEAKDRGRRVEYVPITIW